MAKLKRKFEECKVIITDVEFRGLSIKSGKPFYQIKLIDVDTGELYITYPDEAMRNYRSNWRHICESPNPHGVYFAKLYRKDLAPILGHNVIDGDSELELDIMIDEENVWPLVDLINQYPVKKSPWPESLIEFV